MRARLSAPEEMLALHIRALRLPEPEREYRFHPEREWRFDFAWPDRRIAAEVEGGGWVYGRHHRPKGYEQDCEKYNAATLLGWRVLRFTPEMVRDGRAIRAIEDAIKEVNDGHDDHRGNRRGPDCARKRSGPALVGRRG